ncbi:MAG: phosphonatase-like hydrolase [Acidobacteriota bacterium]
MTNFPALVIFDMAGTTIEDRGQVPAAFTSALNAHGIFLGAEEIVRVRGASKRQAIRSLLPPDRADQADRIYADFRDALSHSYREDGVHAMPGSTELFTDLRARGIKVALTTGFDRDIATLLLTTVGWTNNIFDALVCGEDVLNGRPAPDLILLAMKLTGVSDLDTVANVGDTVLDLESGARAGVKWNIGVLSGAHAREALAQAPHTQLLSSIDDLRF